MKIITSTIILFTLFSCSEQVCMQEPAVIPQPQSIITSPGKFVLNRKTVIVAEGKALPEAEYLRAFLKQGTGLNLEIVSKGKRNAIILSLAENTGDLQNAPEEYLFKSTPKNISISSGTAEGLFYGIQTLRQLLPPEAESRDIAEGIEWNIPVVEISDQARFGWRGVMLDCVRHFFPVSHVKHVLDQLAAHKMNHFHWHLVDDQGWRIEIKKYPELTDISAWRTDREDLHWNKRPPQEPGEKATYGGYYSQEDVLEVIRYADSLHIEVIPEIEMPAHVTCVFASFPQLSCSGKLVTVPPGSVWPITNIYCAGNDEVFSFLEDVLTEVADLFPSDYIHVGGDEATKTNWQKCPKCQARIRNEGLRDVDELQSYFMKRIEKFLTSKGKNMIGWDEILEGGLAPYAAVMSWRGFEGGIEASEAGHNVVMSPTSHCYFDYYQGPKETEPLAIGGFLPLSKVYEFEPVPPSLSIEEAQHILGGQANLWTEYIPTPEHSDYMMFPRLDAMSEVLWTSPGNRNYMDFLVRLKRQFERYHNSGTNYSKSIY